MDTSAILAKLDPQELLPGFRMARIPVTHGIFAVFVGATRYTTSAEHLGTSRVPKDQQLVDVPGLSWRNAFLGEELPVVCMSFWDALAFCRWLTREARGAGLLEPKMRVRLPTEIEWEDAARAGLSDESQPPLAATAWYGDNSDGHPHPVGQKLINNFGLADMLGNVSEWTASELAPDPPDHKPIEDPRPDRPLIVRGGSWAAPASKTQITMRGRALPHRQTNYSGFRIVLGAGRPGVP